MVRMKNSMGMFALMTVVLPVLFSATTWGGDLNPSAAPGPTMKTMDQIPPTWSQILPAAQRFQLVMGGVAVLDKETGLVWEQSPSSSTFHWYFTELTLAKSYCTELSLGNRKGWRLPTIQELASLIDPSVASPGPTLPSGHPFTNVQSDYYWSATTAVNPGGDPDALAWVVYFGNGATNRASKVADKFFAWCVRGGQGMDIQ